MLSETYQNLHRELGIPADYAVARRLPYYAEAVRLVEVGPNPLGRMQRLTPEAAERWRQMTGAAEQDGILLLIVSGFRTFDYQAELIRKKLAGGQEIGEILRVAEKFSVIRFDAAMTLTKKHFQRLWYPHPGTGGDIPSRADHGMLQEDFDRAFGRSTRMPTRRRH